MSVDLERIKTAWEIDIREYEEHFSELVRTQATNGEEPSPEHRESVRQFWKATSHLLHQYVRTHAQLGHYLEPMPAILLSRLALHFDELGNGIVTDLIESARAPGRPTRYGERRDISRGISYLEAVEKGLIQNRAPVKTVAECFNVTRQTVRNWRDRKDEICKGMPVPHPNVIDQAMRDAGRRYSVLGRGAPSE